MEHVIAGHLRQVSEMRWWLLDGQHGFRPGYLLENQVVTVYQYIEDSLDEELGTDAITTGFSKAFELVSSDRLSYSLLSKNIKINI
jgi:hypothetical protein